MGFRAILRALADAEVEFVVVGGVCAVLQGVPTSTLDLDIVHARDEVNRRRLLRVLHELEACYREHLPKRLVPTLEQLDSDGHMLLATKEGPLDLLGSLIGGRSFLDLVPRSERMELGEEARCQVLQLEALIDIKEETGREKDRAQLPLLRRTLEQRRGR